MAIAKPSKIKKTPAEKVSSTVRRGIDKRDWQQIATSMDTEGWALVPKLISAREARSIAAMYPDEHLFRSRIVMARHGFGRGQYKYFTYPLPPLITELRTSFYPHLAELANTWMERMGEDTRYPLEHAEYLERCRRAGQTKSTLTLLEYGAGDYNALHQDIHGENVFPLRVAILLDEPVKDFEGGQFLMSEQRPRMQTRGIVVEPLKQGDDVIFAANDRPVRGSRGDYRVKMRHGVNQVRSGHRHTLGIIFHDAA